MTRRLFSIPLIALLAALLLAGWALAWSHVGEPDHDDSCAFCHLRSERATAVSVSAPLPAPAPRAVATPVSAFLAPRAAPAHCWAARAPPSDDVVSDLSV